MRRPSARALAADAAAVVVFCTVGRRSHAEDLSVATVAETAWPFLTGTAAGWVLARGWRQPTALAPTGVVVWVSTVAIGMALRRSGIAGADHGVSPSFVVVASTTTAVLLLGWRVALKWLTRSRTPHPREPHGTDPAVSPLP